MYFKTGLIDFLEIIFSKVFNTKKKKQAESFERQAKESYFADVRLFLISIRFYLKLVQLKFNS